VTFSSAERSLLKGRNGINVQVIRSYSWAAPEEPHNSQSQGDLRIDRRQCNLRFISPAVAQARPVESPARPGVPAIDWEQRQALRRKPLALWLHGFYSSHAAPFPVKIETLRQLSGSGTKRLRKFEENLRKALDDLETVTGIKGTIDEDDDLVTVERLPSRTQQRHLTRKSKQRRAIRKPRQKQQNWQRLGDF
jgi:hypothetical protein